MNRAWRTGRRSVAATWMGLSTVACSGGAAAPDPVVVTVQLDGVDQPSIPVSVGPPVVLAHALPDGLVWDELEKVRAETASGDHMAVRAPATHQPPIQLTLRLDAEHGVVLDGSGMAEGELKLPLVGVSAIGLTRRKAAPTVPPAVVVQVGEDVPVSLSKASLETLQRCADPRGRVQGWDLADVLQRATNGRAVAQVVLQHGAPEVTTTVLKPLDEVDAYYLVKYSQNNQLRVQHWANSSEKPSEVYREIHGLTVTLVDAPVAPQPE